MERLRGATLAQRSVAEPLQHAMAQGWARGDVAASLLALSYQLAQIARASNWSYKVGRYWLINWPAMPIDLARPSASARRRRCASTSLPPGAKRSLNTCSHAASAASCRCAAASAVRAVRAGFSGAVPARVLLRRRHPRCALQPAACSHQGNPGAADPGRSSDANALVRGFRGNYGAPLPPRARGRRRTGRGRRRRRRCQHRGPPARRRHAPRPRRVGACADRSCHRVAASAAGACGPAHRLPGPPRAPRPQG